MFKKSLTALVAALALTGATLAPMQSAQAGGLGKFIAAGVVGAVVGGALASRSAQADRPSYAYRSEYRPVRGYDDGYRGGCGFRNSPIFDEDGNRIGSRRVPAC